MGRWVVQELRKTQLLLGHRHVERLAARHVAGVEEAAAASAACLAAAAAGATEWPRAPDLGSKSASAASAAAAAAIQQAALSRSSGSLRMPSPLAPLSQQQQEALPVHLLPQQRQQQQQVPLPRDSRARGMSTGADVPQPVDLLTGSPYVSGGRPHSANSADVAGTTAVVTPQYSANSPEGANELQRFGRGRIKQPDI